MNYQDFVYVFYDKINLNIIVTVEPTVYDQDIQKFLSDRHRIEKVCEGRPIEEFGVVVEEKRRFKKFLRNLTNYNIAIDEQTNTVKYVIKRSTIANITYNNEVYKRDFNEDQVFSMYNDDYINTNLKNCYKSGILKFSFKRLDEINLRSHMFNKNWNYFHSDPFLTNSHYDKTILGKSIIENGTYFPIIVAPLINDEINENESKELYVFEGNHRVMSLKLLQLEGIIDGSFKLLCIEYPRNYEMIKSIELYRLVSPSYDAHGLLELYYGSRVIFDEAEYNYAKETVLSSGGKMIDKFKFMFNVKTMEDVLFSLQSYPHWLRDLLFNFPNIKPNPVLNNESLFKEWVNES